MKAGFRRGGRRVGMVFGTVRVLGARTERFTEVIVDVDEDIS